ncbi:hypothetical protein HDIA_1298 [Hartmannibacter diazotrophicus]|uniref:VPEID-CTERM protein sorting domain protein n=1 Tax=Hartmannibacter diazotrophicus TaxID=1482074 RepID=A0A2C9D3T2_9HYPH|nr:hypothetical protein [Hartmannibacter diazotrophicus]SON54839.1 hypothetical protein HDIA_1298 [Hartmannibacter diazotrophicus]
MKKIMYGAAIATVAMFSVAPAFANGVQICDLAPNLEICQALPGNGAPLPIAALGLPIAAGLFAYAKRKQAR